MFETAKYNPAASLASILTVGVVMVVAAILILWIVELIANDPRAGHPDRRRPIGADDLLISRGGKDEPPNLAADPHAKLPGLGLFEETMIANSAQRRREVDRSRGRVYSTTPDVGAFVVPVTPGPTVEQEAFAHEVYDNLYAEQVAIRGPVSHRRRTDNAAQRTAGELIMMMRAEERERRARDHTYTGIAA